MRLEIGRGPRPEHAIGARAQLDLQRRDDGARDVLLHGEHVFQLAIVRLGPQLVAVPRAYELRGDAQPIPAPPDTALENRVHVQPTADVRDVDLAASPPELERRRPPGHAQPLDSAQRGDQLIGETVAEVGLVFRFAEIGEWQHRGRGGVDSRSAAAGAN